MTYISWSSDFDMHPDYLMDMRIWVYVCVKLHVPVNVDHCDPYFMVQ